MRTPCSLSECERDRASAIGYCLMHYKRWKRHGDPTIIKAGRGGMAVLQRTHLYTKGDGCWEWQSKRDQDGYGIVSIDGKHHRATRQVYLQEVGPIPTGMLVCHTCDNPPCINPAHLWLGTYKENSEDMMNKKRWAGGRPKQVRA